MAGKHDLHTLLIPGPAPEAPVIIIYSEQVSSRLDYVCRFIFEHVLKVKHVITSNRSEYETSSFYKINYSDELIGASFHIVPKGLLMQTGISGDKPIPEFKNGLLYFYGDKDETDFGFDIFSAVFFMISRYEEWQLFKTDKHGRFELDQSILFKNKVHQRPVVDLWIMELRKAISLFYKGIVFPPIEFKTISTIDVDNLYAYSHKGFLRTLGAAGKDLLKADIKNLSRRLKAVRGKAKDPFDIYESFTKFCTGHNIPVVYFFLFRTGTEFDRTVDSSSPEFKKVFAKIKSSKGFIGLHPSYYSSEKENILEEEVNDFSKTLDEKVVLSRQHYLKFNIKTTPLQLLKNGITTDFTMGFASGLGFRAGTSYPFFYYNFNTEGESRLLFVPFCAMDGVFTVYDTIPANTALATLQKLKKEVKNTGGFFVTVFHERTFSENISPGFSEMYKDLLTKD